MSPTKQSALNNITKNFNEYREMLDVTDEDQSEDGEFYTNKDITAVRENVTIDAATPSISFEMGTNYELEYALSHERVIKNKRPTAVFGMQEKSVDAPTIEERTNDNEELSELKVVSRTSAEPGGLSSNTERVSNIVQPQ